MLARLNLVVRKPNSINTGNEPIVLIIFIVARKFLDSFVPFSLQALSSERQFFVYSYWMPWVRFDVPTRPTSC